MAKAKNILRLVPRALAVVVAMAIPSMASAGLIHLWEANGDATDSVGSADGALSGGAGFGAGFDGQAFTFSGANQLFTAAVDLSPSNYPEITFGAWVNLNAIENNRGWVIGHDNGGFDRAIALHDNRFGSAPAAGVGSTYASTLPSIALGEWVFVAASYRGNGLATTVYAGGNSQEVLGTDNSDGNDFFSVGGLSNFGGHEIAGSVDNVFIFDRALSVAELREIERRGTPVPAPATLALIGLGLCGIGYRRRRNS